MRLKKVIYHLVPALVLLAIIGTAAAEEFVWKSEIPDDCPFDRSPTLIGVHFTGRHGDYRCGDTFYPSWASDGNLYSPWTDGQTDGVRCSSGGSLINGFRTGHAVMIGEDPLKLVIKNSSPPKKALATPYRGRYPCGSLVCNGIWYYGTYSANFSSGWNGVELKFHPPGGRYGLSLHEVRLLGPSTTSFP